MDNHVPKKRTSGNHRPTTCPDCGKHMSTKNIARHLRLVHGNDEKMSESVTLVDQSLPINDAET